MEGQIAHLASWKINTDQRTANEEVKTVMITDPDGNHIALAEALDVALVR